MPEFVVDPQGLGETAHTLSATPHDLHACAVVLRAAPLPLHAPACLGSRPLLGAVERFTVNTARVVDALAVGAAALGRGLDDVATSWVATEQASTVALGTPAPL